MTLKREWENGLFEISGAGEYLVYRDIDTLLYVSSLIVHTHLAWLPSEELQTPYDGPQLEHVCMYILRIHEYSVLMV